MTYAQTGQKSWDQKGISCRAAPELLSERTASTVSGTRGHHPFRHPQFLIQRALCLEPIVLSDVHARGIGRVEVPFARRKCFIACAVFRCFAPHAVSRSSVDRAVAASPPSESAPRGDPDREQNQNGSIHLSLILEMCIPRCIFWPHGWSDA